MMGDAIPGTRRQFRELVDGTIRVMVDIDPPYRKTFLDTFGEIDMPIALVPLKIGVKTEPELKGGELAKLAGRWCQREDFQIWVARQWPAVYAETPPLDEVSERIAAVIRSVCGVLSRRELDHNPGATHIFETAVRKPFLAHIGAVA